MPQLLKQTPENLPLSALTAPLLMVGSAFLFTIMSTLIKLMPQRYSAWHLGFVRCTGGLLILMVFSRGKNPFKGHNIPLLIFRGVTGIMAFLGAVTAIRLLPLSTACVIFYCYPVFAALFGFFIYKEHITWGQMACIAALLLGMAVFFEFGVTGISLLGVGMSITGSLFAGLVVVQIRALRASNGPAVIYLYFCLIGAVATLVPCILDPIYPKTAGEWTMLAGISLTSLLAQLMMNYGFQFCKGFEGGVYLSSETIFTAAIGIGFLHDPVSWHFWTGGCLILGSGLVLNRISMSKNKTPVKCASLPPHLMLKEKNRLGFKKI